MRANHLVVMMIVACILGSFQACKKDAIPEKYDYTYTNSYIRDTIMYRINLGTIGNKHLFIVNENNIYGSVINGAISSIQKEDIISVTFINKAVALASYGTIAKDGIVKINYYIDPLLKPAYYVTNNTDVMNLINALVRDGKVVRYPLIVLDGKPLIGTDIKGYLDHLNNAKITSMFLMDLMGGLQIYGEIAINGVILINTIIV
jgi:hypothetical protein